MIAGRAVALPAVALREVCFAYGRGRRAVEVLRGVSATVERGTLFGVLGPNGSGKSTLFRLLATLARPIHGSIEVHGHDSAVAAAEVRRALGVVFQSPSLDPHLTVRENLWYHGRIHGMSRRALAGEVDLALGRFGLSGPSAERDRAGERVKTLSGGLRRRVELAKALLTRPAVLLLDEPSSGLDPAARHDLRNALMAVRDAGTTVLLTTHLMEEADVCDALLLLDGGAVVARGTPAALREEVAGEVVRIEGPNPEALRTAVAALRPDQPVTAVPGAIHLTVPGDGLALLADLLPALRSRLAERGDVSAEITAVAVARPTLEDVFLRRTGRGLLDGRSAGSDEGATRRHAVARPGRLVGTSDVDGADHAAGGAG